MQTIKTNPILKDEKRFTNLERTCGNFQKKKDSPSCFYNYAANRAAEFSGFTENTSGDFIKLLGLNVQ